jgi:hypothetical protein
MNPFYTLTSSFFQFLPAHSYRPQVVFFSFHVAWQIFWVHFFLPFTFMFNTRPLYELYWQYTSLGPIIVAARSKARTVFACSDTGAVGSNPTLAVDVCVYSVFALFCVYVQALRRADPPSKESYRLCLGSRHWNADMAKQWAVEP